MAPSALPENPEAADKVVQTLRDALGLVTSAIQGQYPAPPPLLSLRFQLVRNGSRLPGCRLPVPVGSLLAPCHASFRANRTASLLRAEVGVAHRLEPEQLALPQPGVPRERDHHPHLSFKRRRDLQVIGLLESQEVELGLGDLEPLDPGYMVERLPLFRDREQLPQDNEVVVHGLG